MVSRKPLTSIGPNVIASTTGGINIRDKDLQQHLARVTRNLEGKAFEAALVAFAASCSN